METKTKVDEAAAKKLADEAAAKKQADEAAAKLKAQAARKSKSSSKTRPRVSIARNFYGRSARGSARSCPCTTYDPMPVKH